MSCGWVLPDPGVVVEFADFKAGIGGSLIPNDSLIAVASFAFADSAAFGTDTGRVARAAGFWVEMAGAAVAGVFTSGATEALGAGETGLGGAR